MMATTKYSAAARALSGRLGIYRRALHLSTGLQREDRRRPGSTKHSRIVSWIGLPSRDRYVSYLSLPADQAQNSHMDPWDNPDCFPLPRRPLARPSPPRPQGLASEACSRSFVAQSLLPRARLGTAIQSSCIRGMRCRCSMHDTISATLTHPCVSMSIHSPLSPKGKKQLRLRSSAILRFYA